MSRFSVSDININVTASDTEATIDFDAVEGATVYAVQYKVGGAHDWRRVRFQIIILI